MTRHKDKPKCTNWFPGSVKPVRPGVYKRLYDAGGSQEAYYAKWNGKWWGSYGFTPDAAIFWQTTKSNLQSLPWPGLANDPNEVK